MTRYILVGGGERQHPTYGTDIAKILAGQQRPLRVLSCNFAKPREFWESAFLTWQQYLVQHFGADTLVEMAMPDRFEEQVVANDIIYIHGGDDMLLETYLSRYKHLSQLFEGKTVIGSSAGATFLCTYAWTCDWRAIWKGAGLINARCIVHYGSDFGIHDPRGPIDWGVAVQALEQFEPDIPLYRLAEGRFEIIDTP